MSGIYIKGMEMPKPKLSDAATIYDAYIRVRPDGNAVIVVDDWDEIGFTECPLVPVLEHGRLIYADALKETIEALIEKHLHGYTKSTWDFVCELRRIISDAPTIIPAEEGK